MASYTKPYTKGQATRAIRVGQSGFITGINLDLPRKEVESSGLIQCDNAIPYRSNIEPRAGSSLFGLPPIGAGTFHGWIRHPKGKFVGHWGDELYISDDANVWTQTTGTWGLADADSTIKVFGNDIVVFQADRMLILELRDDDHFLRLLNAPNPQVPPPISTTDEGDGAYVYRFTYTFARYVDDVLIAESGAYSGDSYTGYYTELSFTNPLSGDNNVFINGTITPNDGEDGISTQWTHVNFYRTRDIGVNNENYKDIYYLANSYDVESLNGVGIGEMVIQGSPIFKISDTRGKLSVADDVIIGRPLLNKLFYIPLPNSLIGSISDGVIFCQNGTDMEVNFSFTGVKERSGYYFEGSQSQKINGNLTDLISIDGGTVVLCSDRTYFASEDIFEQTDDILGANLGNVIFSLYPFKNTDTNIGVRDRGTVSMIDQNRFIAVCNDGSVRIYDGGWSNSDMSSRTVSTETKRIATGSSSVFHPDGYYLLSYSTDEAQTTAPKTLRRGLLEDVGVGWSTYSGDGWMNPNKTNSYIKTVYDGNFIILCVDSNNKIYQIETYDGPEGSGLIRRSVDRFGDDKEYPVTWKAEFSPIHGSQEAFWVRHLKTNLFLSDFYRGVAALSTDEVVVSILKDDEDEIFDNYVTARNFSDVAFSKDAIAHSFRMMVEVNNNHTTLTSYETILEVIDMPNVDFDKDQRLMMQEKFASNLYFSMGRARTTFNNVKTMKSGDKIGVDVGVVTNVTGPDGLENTGVEF